MSKNVDLTIPVRRSKFTIISAVVVVLWLAIAGIGGPLFGSLSKVQKNDNSQFLPANAETTKVTAIVNKQAAGADLPVTIAYEKPNGAINFADAVAICKGLRAAAIDPALTPYFSKTKVPAAVASANPCTLPAVRTFTPSTANTAPKGTLVDVPKIFPQDPASILASVSKNGHAVAALVFMDFNAIANSEKGFNHISELVDLVAAHVHAPTAEIASYPTGAGGLFAQFSAAFKQLDGQLLFVTVGVIAVILLIVYRSPILFIFPLLSALFSLALAVTGVYALAKNDIISLSGQSQGIMYVLVLGAATDYALLLISRYREELRKHESAFRAMGQALRAVWEPIVASGATVAVGVFCLTFSDLKSNSALGPTGSLGVVSALIASMTFLPAVLVLCGRFVFWPFIPKFGSELAEVHGLWGKLSRGIGRRAPLVWTITGLGLAAMCAFVPSLKAAGISQVDFFVNKNNVAVQGFNVLERNGLAPKTADSLITSKADQLQQVCETAKKVPHIAFVRIQNGRPSAATEQSCAVTPGSKPTVVDGYGFIDVTYGPTQSATENDAITSALRNAVHAVPSAEALVGGSEGANYDVKQASIHDRNLIIPIVLVVITIILALLLRSLLAPLVLLGTVLLSFGATLGVCALVFTHVFKFAGADASFPLFAFVFLVAVGIDYNIFLMTRVREESIKEGTRKGTLHALAVTGAVITSAGVVLAATFSALAVLPLVFLAEIGFAVAFGVLLDTLIVRSLLVPALVHHMGKKVWWPSKLSRDAEPTGEFGIL